MSHTNQTANYHLPQFIGTDKPAWLVDFNQAMSDIDTQMKANETSAGTAEADAQSALSGVTALNSQVGGIQTSVTALETQAPLDEAQIETNRQNIATNAQNIVDLDNRMGHTSISGIGDGSATGAIKSVDDKVGDLSDLDTTDKSSIVDAINEVVAGGGGDASTVRYNNGWIEYTPDGGTTWVQLINTETPEQLLPVMTSNTSVLGTASVSGTTGSDIPSTDAYKVIGDSDITYAGTIGHNGAYLAFEFTNPTFVQSITVLAQRTGSGTQVVSLDWSEDGITWISGGQNIITSSYQQLAQAVNATVKAIRYRFLSGDSTGGSQIKEFKAWN